jgi:5'(3')-deoxyribonucleotidase
MWELLETPGLFSDMVKPPEDSVNVTKILSNFFELYVVTSCSHPNIIIEKFQYIEKHFPHIHTSDIITCKNKSLIKGNYMIDDYVGNIRAFDGVGLLLNTSYNINIDIPINVYRMGTWNDILIFFSMGNKELRDYLSSDLFKNSGTYIEKFDIKTISGIKSYFNIQKRIVK